MSPRKGKKMIEVSKLLEESIEQTSITIEIDMRHNLRSQIDKVDDERRKEKRRGEEKHLFLMNCAIEKLKKTISEDDFVNEFNLCFLEETFKRFEQFIKEENRKEDILESLDDENRESLKEYIVQKREESKNRSERIELRIIKNNI